jgi:hypothetical protein
LNSAPRLQPQAHATLGYISQLAIELQLPANQGFFVPRKRPGIYRETCLRSVASAEKTSPHRSLTSGRVSTPRGSGGHARNLVDAEARLTGDQAERTSRFYGLVDEVLDESGAVDGAGDLVAPVVLFVPPPPS